MAKYLILYFFANKKIAIATQINAPAKAIHHSHTAIIL
jgi:hypothetical protein